MAGVVAIAAIVVAGCAAQDGVRVMGAVPARPTTSAPTSSASVVSPPNTTAVSAPPVAAPPVSTPPPAPSGPSLDPVRLLRADPRVRAQVKQALQPCPGGRYPVDARFPEVTGDGVADILVNVFSCDGVDFAEPFDPITDVPLEDFLGGYVYAVENGVPRQVLAQEIGGSQVDVAEDTVYGLRAVHEQGDPPCCPTGFVPLCYDWTGSAFTGIEC